MKIKKWWYLTGLEDLWACFFKTTCFFLLFSLLSNYIHKIKFKINTVKGYWRLKNIQMRLAKCFLWMLGHACSKMIDSSCSSYLRSSTVKKSKSDVNQHHLTSFPDKTNDAILLKSPKTLHLGHFWPYLIISAQMGFSHKIQLYQVPTQMSP